MTELRALAYPVGGARRCGCGRKFGTYRERLRHQADDHGSPAETVCFCGQVFGAPANLARHLVRSHPGDKVMVVPGASGVVFEARKVPDHLAIDADPDGRLHCSSCEWRTGLATRMNVHTLLQHGRHPTRHERTPQ